jgi:uncharacterized RDD family membrane protein YckC
MNKSVEATPASLWLRLLAAVYDLLPLLGLWLAAAALAVLVTGGAIDTHQLRGKLLVQALVLIATATYFVVSWIRGGQTIGMRAWRLRVVRANGTPLNARQALLRFATGVASVAAFGMGFWWALIDRERRTWHDRAAGTVVVRLDKAPAQK